MFFGMTRARTWPEGCPAGSWLACVGIPGNINKSMMVCSMNVRAMVTYIIILCCVVAMSTFEHRTIRRYTTTHSRCYCVNIQHEVSISELHCAKCFSLALASSTELFLQTIKCRTCDAVEKFVGIGEGIYINGRRHFLLTRYKNRRYVKRQLCDGSTVL
jgi:hypothetical protein